MKLLYKVYVDMDVKYYTFLIFLSVVYSNDNIVDYYENLINAEIRRASEYRFPKDATEYKPEHADIKDFGTYDFVVIGGGSAGSVVASRLSEVSKWKILLLEAGKEETNFTDIPSMSVYTSSLEYNWGFNSTPQKTCCLAMGGECPFPRGKALGGTSVINALIYVRGNPADYDKWAAQGNPGWSYEDVLPYFIKSENSNIIGDEGYHGTDGLLNIDYHVPTSKKVDVFLQANEEEGRSILDYNGKEQLGASRTQFTTIHGRRESSAKAFLNPARNRTNLKILTNSYVTKILISNTTKTAHGVIFSHNKTQYLVKIGKEVILSAGVVGSPQILMLSGVGPADHLKQHQISVVKDLSVGKDMHDHLTFYNMYHISPKPEPSHKLREAIKQYLNGTGPLTISTNPQGLGFFQLGLTNTTTADLEVVFVPSIKSSGFDAVRKGLIHGHVDKENINFWDQAALENHIFQIVLVLLHPKTRGNIYLKSSNPYDYPLIESRCLDDPEDEDIENLYLGIQRVLKLLDTDAFKKLGAVLLPYPHCISHHIMSKAYWKCVIRQTAMNAYHGGGTCRMGPDPSKGAVVDNKLKVYGISNLRVADTSIVPLTLAAHMNAPAMMIGERAADFIKEEHNATEKN